MFLFLKYPFKKSRFLTGFTLIEILLVIACLAILVTLTIPVSLDFYRSQQLNSFSQGILQILRRAQLKAMSVENNSSFGVYLTNDSYTLFQGKSYKKRYIEYDEVFDLPQIITVSGVQEVVFSKFEGLPSFEGPSAATGTIILSDNGDSRTITINEAGRVNLE